MTSICLKSFKMSFKSAIWKRSAQDPDDVTTKYREAACVIVYTYVAMQTSSLTIALAAYLHRIRSEPFHFYVMNSKWVLSVWNSHFSLMYRNFKKVKSIYLRLSLGYIYFYFCFISFVEATHTTLEFSLAFPIWVAMSRYAYIFIQGYFEIWL